VASPARVKPLSQENEARVLVLSVYNSILPFMMEVRVAHSTSWTKKEK